MNTGEPESQKAGVEGAPQTKENRRQRLPSLTSLRNTGTLIAHKCSLIWKNNSHLATGLLQSAKCSRRVAESLALSFGTQYAYIVHTSASRLNMIWVFDLLGIRFLFLFFSPLL
jgi:hypothetical protein